MKNHLILTLSISFFAIASNSAGLGESAALAADKPSVVLTQARFKEFKPMPGEKVVRGEVLRAGTDTFVIRDIDGKELSVKVDQKTITLAEFKPGDRVQAHVNEEGYASVIKYVTPDEKEAKGEPGALQSQDSQRPQAAEVPHQTLRGQGSAKLLPSQRVIIGIVEELRGDLVKVRTGEIETLHLSTKQGREKGIDLKKGDHVEIIVNSDNAVVDYHPVGDPASHKIIRGRVAELADGVEWAIIVTDAGDRVKYPVQGNVRSRLKQVFTGVPALFLIGENNDIIDALALNDKKIEQPLEKLQGSSDGGQGASR
jgi:hypothetical protein